MCDTLEPALAIGVPGLQTEEPPSRLWLALLHLLALLSGFFGPGFMLMSTLKCHCGGQLTACKSNCKNIATALEMYSSDFGGRYPSRLQELTVGGYLKKLPTCPTAGEMTYINYHVSQNPDSFRFGCVGNYHEKAYTGYDSPSFGYPRYDAEIGLIDHP